MYRESCRRSDQVVAIMALVLGIAMYILSHASVQFEARPHVQAPPENDRFANTSDGGLHTKDAI